MFKHVITWGSHFSESGDRLIDLLDGNSIHFNLELRHLDNLSILVSGDNRYNGGPVTLQVIAMVLRKKKQKKSSKLLAMILNKAIMC